MILSPLGLFGEIEARQLFILANAIAIVFATYFLLRVFGFGLRTVAAPICYFAIFISEPVVNTLTFGNINGFIFLAEALYINFLISRRDLWAGVVLGLTIVTKPTLAPLLLIAAARRQWSTIFSAISVPILITAVAWPLSADPVSYFQRNLPYSLEIRDYFNSSISGIALYYGVSSPVAMAARLLLAIVTAATLWLLFRYYVNDDVFFVCTAAGVIMTAEFILASLGQQYYSIYIYPLIMTVVMSQSLIRNWPAWLAIFGFVSYDKWLLYRSPSLGRDLEYLRVPFGWSLLLIVVFCVLSDRYLTARREGRLRQGIDSFNVAPDLSPLKSSRR